MMENKSTEEKKRLISKHAPHSPLLKNGAFAFLFGGIICLIGEGLFVLFDRLGVDENTSASLVTASLIFASAILTAFGIFDKIAKRAGAGTLVPVTGFSNAVVSEAMDASNEGYVLGVGAKIFTVAGPVILFGLASGVLYGIIYFLISVFTS